jgi:ATP dependent DNA ligase-like protein
MGKLPRGVSVRAATPISQVTPSCVSATFFINLRHDALRPLDRSGDHAASTRAITRIERSSVVFRWRATLGLRVEIRRLSSARRSGDGSCTLFSRNGHPFGSFSELGSRIGYALIPQSVVMDGEVVCLDSKGRCQFNDLLFRSSEPCFVAFDLLQTNGKDLTRERLLDRKHELKRITRIVLHPLRRARRSGRDSTLQQGLRVGPRECGWKHGDSG